MAEKYLQQAKELLMPYWTKAVNQFNGLSPAKKVAVSAGLLTTSSVGYLVFSYNFSALLYPKYPKIYYEVTGDLKNNDGIIVFVHGWPDSVELFAPQVEYFSKQRNYCSICLEIPNFHIDRNSQNPWGYPHLDISLAMMNQLQAILREAGKEDEEIFLCGHDWGTMIVQIMLYENQTRKQFKLKKLILLACCDFNPDYQNRFLWYTSGLAACFLFPGFIGTPLMRNTETICAEVNPGAMPILLAEKKEKRQRWFSGQNYLYFYYFMGMFFGTGMKGFFEMSQDKDKHLELLSTLPVCFIHGDFAKTLKIFTKQAVQSFTEREDSEFVELKCGHWLTDPTYGEPDNVNKAMLSFMQR